MQYDVLSNRIRALQSAYAQADLSGTRLANTIARSSVVAAPAAAAVQGLSKALFAQTAQQGQSINALESKLRSLSATEKNIGTQVGAHRKKMAEERAQLAEMETQHQKTVAAERQGLAALHRERRLARAMAQQDLATLQTDLATIQKEQAAAKANQVLLEQDRNMLRKREAALASIPVRTRKQEKELVEVRGQQRDVAKEETKNDSALNRLGNESLRNQALQAKAKQQDAAAERRYMAETTKAYAKLTQLPLDYALAEEKAEKKIAQARKERRQANKDQIQQLQEQRAEFQKLAQTTLDVSAALRGVASSAARAFTVTGAAMAVRENMAFNQTLIATNSALGMRENLWKGVLNVQQQTGDSLQNLAELTEVLRGQAMLYRKDWSDVLTVASKLSQGLGASSSEIADMLNASRALKVSFGDLANSVTNVVNKTSLSVRETVSLVTELRRVLTGFNVNAAGGALDGPLKSLVALEQAMKERGAKEGSAQRALSQFTSMSQKGGMGYMFGSGGLDFFQSQSRTDAVIRNLARYLEPFRNIPIVFERMSASVGLSIDEAQMFIDASKKRHQVEVGLTNNRIDLDKRFAEQSAISGKVWNQFGQQLKAFLIEALTPVNRGVVWLGESLGKLRLWLAEAKAAMPDWAKATVSIGAVGTVFGAVALAAGAAARTLWLTVAALRAVAAMGPGGVAGKAAASAAGGSLLSALGGLLGLGGGPASPAAPTRSIKSQLARQTVVARAAGSTAPALRAAATVGGRVLAGAATSAAGFIAGLLPLMSAALPVLIPIALGGIAAYGAYKLFSGIIKENKANSDQDDRMKKIAQEALERRQAGFIKRTDSVKDTLRESTSIVGLRKFNEEVQKQRSVMKGSEAPQNRTMLQEWERMATAKLGAIEATISEEKKYATVERMSELDLMREEMVAALEKIGQIYRDVFEAEQAYWNKQREKEAVEARQAAVQARVQKAASAAAEKTQKSDAVWGAVAPAF